MNLPDFPDLTDEHLRAVLERHGLSGSTVERLPNVGIFNAIFRVGDDLILRVPRRHPAFEEATRKEFVAVPAARAAGVRTPALVVADDTLEVLPVPYGLYERVRGRPLEHLPPDVAGADATYREVGRDLARLHGTVRRSGEIAELALEELPPPDAWPEEFEREGYVGASEAQWLARWLRHLREVAGEPPEGDVVFRHGDLQATNILVRDDGSYEALIDWGACGWGDAAHDFAGVPFRAVPSLLEGYREEREIAPDGSFEARVVLRQLHIALFLARRGRQPDKSWAERPLGVLLDLLRGLATSSDERWRALLI